MFVVSIAEGIETANLVSARSSDLLRVSSLFESCWSSSSPTGSNLAVGDGFFAGLEAAVVLEDFCMFGGCVFARGALVLFFGVIVFDVQDVVFVRGKVMVRIAMG